MCVFNFSIRVCVTRVFLSCQAFTVSKCIWQLTLSQEIGRLWRLEVSLPPLHLNRRDTHQSALRHMNHWIRHRGVYMSGIYSLWSQICLHTGQSLPICVLTLLLIFFFFFFQRERERNYFCNRTQCINLTLVTKSSNVLQKYINDVINTHWYCFSYLCGEINRSLCEALWAQLNHFEVYRFKARDKW